jgi:sigma-B regulation protein RsbU (phosphoserine phosphatase)
MKILFVEDDPTTRRLLQTTMQSFGHDIIVAEEGEQAWAALLKSPVQVIVSDWMMPGLDGLELCKRVRSRQRKDYTYFILLTARTEKDDYHLAMDAGVDDFLVKPLETDELRIRLRVAERILRFIDQVRELKRLLPICSYCKKIRDDKDYWHQIDTYIRTQMGADLSHSICPDCYEQFIKPQLSSLSDEKEPGNDS